MAKVPGGVALKVTGAAQLELLVPGLRAQLVGVKLPPVGLLLKLTVPRVLFFMELAISVILALSVLDALRIFSAAAQLTTVVVVRACTVIVAGVVLALGLWVVSPLPGV